MSILGFVIVLLFSGSGSGQWLTHGEWVIATLTAIYVAITGFYAWTSHKTLVAIQDQSRSSAEQLTVAQSSVAAMRDQVSEMKEARKQTDELIKQAGAQVEALGIAAKATASSARAALLNAQFIVKAERAWVLLENIERTMFLSPEQSHCIVKIRNYGNTPARVGSARFVLLVGTRSLPPNIAGFFVQTDTPSTDVIPPGVTATHYAFSDPLRPEQVTALQEDAAPPWVCGVIKYHDVFEGPGKLHETRFCYSRGPGFAWIPDPNAPVD